DHGVFSERTWRVADLDAKRELMLSGFGWGQMPLHRVESDLREGRLIRLTLSGIPGVGPRLRLYAMHRKADPPGPAARWLLERLTSGEGEGASVPGAPSRRFFLRDDALLFQPPLLGAAARLGGLSLPRRRERA